jgi:hypothetical protein
VGPSSLTNQHIKSRIPPARHKFSHKQQNISSRPFQPKIAANPVPPVYIAPFFSPGGSGHTFLVECLNHARTISRTGVVNIFYGDSYATIRSRIHTLATRQHFKAHEVFTDFEGSGGVAGKDGSFVVWADAGGKRELKVGDQYEFLRH